MKNIIFNRSLVCGIILLFVGLGITSSISGSYDRMNNQYDIINRGYSQLSNSLLAYWNFDEGSGSIVHDDSGHGYDGTIHEATWTNGHSVYALNFNGLNSYVDLNTYSEDLGFSKGDNYEISAWVQTDSTSAGAIYSMSNTNSTLLYADISMASNGSFIFRVGTVECTLTVTSSPGYNDDDWHFVEGKWYGSATNPTIEIYVDSELEATLTEWQCPFNANQFETAKIGRKSADASDHFNGIIDEVKVYKSTGGNTEPEAPTISGEKNGKAGTEYEYTFKAADADEDDVRYHIDWGDGNQEWTTYYTQDIEVKVKHTFEKKGTFTIISYAQDIHGADGDTSNYVVTMPKSKESYFNFNLLDWIYNIYQNAFPILRNLLGS